jgi:tetrahydromethanopterin S-methyltransferase subunit D
MSALGGAKPAGGSTGIAPVPALISLVIFVVIFAIMYMYGGSLGLTALIGIVIGGLLIGFGVHFVPVGGAPAAMGQAPGIATGVAMLVADSPVSLVVHGQLHRELL